MATIKQSVLSRRGHKYQTVLNNREDGLWIVKVYEEVEYMCILGFTTTAQKQVFSKEVGKIDNFLSKYLGTYKEVAKRVVEDYEESIGRRTKVVHSRATLHIRGALA